MGNVRLRRKTPLNSILVANKALSFGAHRLFFFSFFATMTSNPAQHKRSQIAVLHVM